MTVIDPNEKPVDYKAIADQYEGRKTQVEKIYRNWQSDKRIKAFPEDHRKAAAVILDNQQLVRSSLSYSSEMMAASVNILAESLKDNFLFDIIEVSPMLGPVDKIYMTQFKYVEDEISLALIDGEVAAKTKILRGRIDATFMKRENWLGEIAESIRDQMIREVCTDLRNNAGTVASKDIEPGEIDYEKIYLNIVEISGVIFRKTLRGGVNWLVTGPTIGKMLADAARIDIGEIKRPQYVFTMNGAWKVYVDPLYPNNEILCGNKSTFIDGYFYCPYVLLSEGGTILDPESYEPSRQMMSRYGKKLVSPKPYGRIKYNVKQQKKEEAPNYQI